MLYKNDARNLDDMLCFDKVLLDAPCSGSGTININDRKLDKIDFEDLIKRSSKLQYQLLKKAVNVTKRGGTIIYSTCSILNEENEQNIANILKSGKVKIVPIDGSTFKGAHTVKSKIVGTLKILPTNLYEGFFIAKLVKI